MNIIWKQHENHVIPSFHTIFTFFVWSSCFYYILGLRARSWHQKSYFCLYSWSCVFHVIVMFCKKARFPACPYGQSLQVPWCSVFIWESHVAGTRLKWKPECDWYLLCCTCLLGLIPWGAPTLLGLLICRKNTLSGHSVRCREAGYIALVTPPLPSPSVCKHASSLFLFWWGVGCLEVPAVVVFLRHIQTAPGPFKIIG
jgi:hypothetical protein